MKTRIKEDQGINPDVAASGEAPIHPLEAEAGLEPQVRGDLLMDYLVQVHREIDVEKQEGTKILHLKIIVAGLTVAFGRGEEAAALVFLPFAFISLDLMQASRLEYILDRWTYLAQEVGPRMRYLFDPKGFPLFAEIVIQKASNSEYDDLESAVRTFLMLPVVLGSAAASWALLLNLGLSRNLSWSVALTWGLTLFLITIGMPKIYIRRYTAAVFVLFSLVALLLSLSPVVAS